MRLRFVQTIADFTASYVALDGDIVKYHAEIPCNFRGCYADFLQNGQLKYRLCFDKLEGIKNLVRAGKYANGNPYTIWNPDGQLLGHIFLKETKFF